MQCLSRKEDRECKKHFLSFPVSRARILLNFKNCPLEYRPFAFGFFIQADKGGLVWHHALACMESTSLALYGILRSRPLRRLDSMHPVRDDSIRHSVSIPCRLSADSIHATVVILARRPPCFFFFYLIRKSREITKTKASFSVFLLFAFLCNIL